MKLEDVQVGQRLKDQYGNQFRVLSVEPRDAQCVELECTHFNRCVNVDGDVYFESTGQAWWVVRDQDCIRQSLSVSEIIDAYAVGYQKWLLVESDTQVDITLESLEVVCD